MLYETGRFEELFDELQIQLKVDPLNEELRTLFKEVIHENKGNEDGFESFIGKAEKEYRAKLKKELDSAEKESDSCAP